MRRFNTTCLRQDDGSNKAANLMFGVGSKDLCLLCNSGRTDYGVNTVSNYPIHNLKYLYYIADYLQPVPSNVGSP